MRVKTPKEEQPQGEPEIINDTNEGLWSHMLVEGPSGQVSVTSEAGCGFIQSRNQQRCCYVFLK